MDSEAILAKGNILNTFNPVEGTHVLTFPFYNGREFGICLLVGKTAISNKVLAINFGRNRNSDSLFVQARIIDRPFNCPSVESGTFDEKSYKDRKYFESDEYVKAAKAIVSLIRNCDWLI